MAEIHEGDVVRKLREERKWSRDKLAEESQVRPNTLGELEKYGARNLKTLRSVAKALGVEIEDIFCMLKDFKYPENKVIECSDPEYEEYHKMLELILHAPEEESKIGIISILKAMAAHAEASNLAVPKRNQLPRTPAGGGRIIKK